MDFWCLAAVNRLEVIETIFRRLESRNCWYVLETEHCIDIRLLLDLTQSSPEENAVSMRLDY